VRHAAGQAYFRMGRYEEAIAAWKQSLALNPHFLAPRVALVGGYSLVGREEEARAEVAEVLKRNPHFSVEVLKQRSPDSDSARSEQFFAALRKAGLE
jgi:tetratricopeptide (TPR) repeat protein